MSFEADLRDRLVNDAAVAAIVGARVYWDIRPQDSALPALVLRLVNGARDASFGGAMGTQGNQVQFDCMAASKSVSMALRNAAIAVAETPGVAGATGFQGGIVDLYRSMAEDTASGLVRTEQVRATIWFN